MGVIKTEILKSPSFVPGDADIHRGAIQDTINSFLTTIAPQDVLQLTIDYVQDSKYAGQYTWVGCIVYYIP